MKKIADWWNEFFARVLEKLADSVDKIRTDPNAIHDATILRAAANIVRASRNLQTED